MLHCSRALLVRAPVARARAERAVIAEVMAEEASTFTKSYHRSGGGAAREKREQDQLRDFGNDTHRDHSFSSRQSLSTSSSPHPSQRNDHHDHDGVDVGSDGGAASGLVNSLQDFFAELRRMRRDIGKASSRDRNLAREDLTRFWSVNIGFAMASCARARDIGFVSFYGISDSHLELPAHLIPSAIQLLVRDAKVCNALDTTVSLRYLSREISRILTSPRATAEDRQFIPPALVTAFVEHGLERLQFLFVERTVGEPEDAVHGLEFILSLCNGQPSAPMLTEALLLHAARGDMLMTLLIGCFGILRASLPKLERAVSAQICLELLRALKRKDDKLKNPFHFVKVLMTMVRIDSQYLTQPSLWQYIILKACIFVPNASPDHRRLMVMSIRTMLRDRGLEHLLTDLALEVQGTHEDEYEVLIAGPILSLKKDA
jgi:hypothetical protein